MSIVFAQGWELGAGAAWYTGAGWTASGTVPNSNNGTVPATPNTWGGGEFSLRCALSRWLQTTNEFEAPNLGTLNTMVMADANFTSSSDMLQVIDDTGTPMLEVRPVDGASSSRLQLRHNGVPIATTTKTLEVGVWYRLAVRWHILGSNITGKLFVDGELVTAGTVALTTSATAAGLLWGSGSSGNTYHDHTVVYDDGGADTLHDTWIQGLRPDADHAKGLWTANPSSSTIWPRLRDPEDAGFAETSSTSGFHVALEDRPDVDPGWMDFTALAVNVLCAAKGDGAGLLNGKAYLQLGATDTIGDSIAMPTGGGVARVFAEDKPGGDGWAHTDLQNILAGYEAL